MEKLFKAIIRATSEQKKKVVYKNPKTKIADGKQGPVIKRDLDDDFPDFMERDPSKSYVSNGILGILYRDIQNENALYQFIKNDWENSICLQYSLDDKILGLVSSSSRQMHQYLFEVYREIV